MSKFSKLEGKLEKKGYSKKYAGAVAHKAGVEKYGQKEMTKKSVAGRKKAAKKK